MKMNLAKRFLAAAFPLVLGFNAVAQSPSGRIPLSSGLENFLAEQNITAIMDLSGGGRGLTWPLLIEGENGFTSGAVEALFYERRIPGYIFRNVTPDIRGSGFFLFAGSTKDNIHPAGEADIYYAGHDANHNNVVDRAEIELIARADHAFSLGQGVMDYSTLDDYGRAGKELYYDISRAPTGEKLYGITLMLQGESDLEEEAAIPEAIPENLQSEEAPVLPAAQVPLKKPVPQGAEKPVPQAVEKPVLQAVETTLPEAPLYEEVKELDPSLGDFFEKFPKDALNRFVSKARRADQNMSVQLAMAEADAAALDSTDYVAAAIVERMEGAVTKFAPGYLYVIGKDDNRDGRLEKAEIRWVVEQVAVTAKDAKDVLRKFNVASLLPGGKSYTLSQTGKNGRMTGKGLSSP